MQLMDGSKDVPELSMSFCIFQCLIHFVSKISNMLANILAPQAQMFHLNISIYSLIMDMIMLRGISVAKIKNNKSFHTVN